MSERITLSELARRLGVSASAMTAAARKGRVSVGADGRVDPVGGAAEYEANRQRRRRAPPTGAGAPAATDPPAGADFWTYKTAREKAEAGIAALREAELRGDLVRKAVVERELAGRLVALREALESLGDRLGPLLAAENTSVACRNLVLAEIRLALAAFAGAADTEAADDAA